MRLVTIVVTASLLSLVPRPYHHPSRSVSTNGSVDQSSRRAGTTSRCAISMIGLPLALPRRRATTSPMLSDGPVTYASASPNPAARRRLTTAFAAVTVSREPDTDLIPISSVMMDRASAESAGDVRVCVEAGAAVIRVRRIRVTIIRRSIRRSGSVVNRSLVRLKNYSGEVASAGERRATYARTPAPETAPGSQPALRPVEFY